MKILAQRWIGTNLNKCVGIIAIPMTHNHFLWSAFLGVGEGEDEIEDYEKIILWGGRLTEMEARAFFPQFWNLKYYGTNIR